MTTYAAYIAIAFAISVILTIRTDKKIFGFIVIFWITSQPILHYNFSPRIPGLNFDLQPNRMLGVVFLLYMLFALVSYSGNAARNATLVNRFNYEKYFFLYLIAVIASVSYNFSEIKPQDIVVLPSGVAIFILAYFAVKRHITPALFEAILRAIVVLAVLNAFIAIVQIVGNSEFLKTCPPRPAFGSIVRASGIFAAEYELGYFQILAIMVCILRYREFAWQRVVIPLLSLSVIFTFHRLNLLILITCGITYAWMCGSITKRVVTTVVLVLIGALAVASFAVLEPLISDTAIVKERLAADTVSGRFGQYAVVAGALPSFPLGSGSYENPAYEILMAENGHMQSIDAGTENWKQVPYRVHNGYLEVGILHGPLAMMIFMFMLVSLLTSLRRLSRDFFLALIPFFGTLIWMLANISNGVSNLGVYFAVLVGILSGGVVGLAQRVKQNEMQANVKFGESCP
jgi:hypothetical protein